MARLRRALLACALALAAAGCATPPVVKRDYLEQTAWRGSALTVPGRQMVVDAAAGAAPHTVTLIDVNARAEVAGDAERRARILDRRVETVRTELRRNGIATADIAEWPGAGPDGVQTFPPAELADEEDGRHRPLLSGGMRVRVLERMTSSRLAAVIASEAKQSRGTSGALRPLDCFVAIARRKTGVLRRPMAPRNDGGLFRGSVVSPIVVVLNGPNLNLLGKREPEIYGRETLADVEADCRRVGDELGLAIEFHQSNREYEIIDLIHGARERAAGIVINPAAFTHTSVAILDALHTFAGPIIEVHISNVHKREPFRHHSFVSGVASGVIVGCGTQGYAFALQRIAKLIGAQKGRAERSRPHTRGGNSASRARMYDITAQPPARSRPSPWRRRSGSRSR